MMRKALIALTVVLVSGCVTGDIIGSKSSVGTYVLKTVNGASLPVTLSTSGTVKTELLDETINLYEGFTLAKTTHRRITTGTVVTTDSTNDSGTWSPTNDEITFRFNSDPNNLVYAILKNNSFTMNLPGVTRIYKKQ
jgi:hypothetical protein